MTIIRRFDSGHIKGYRVPGSRFRRIPKDTILRYAAEHHLPVYDIEELCMPKSPTPPPELPGVREGRALIVEDDRHLGDIVEKLLTADGWEVRIARNGFDAAFMALTFRPKLVLMDILLPGLDGREACREIRAERRLDGVKILAMTALKDDKSKAEIFAAGADAYLSKPFDLKTLRETVAELTGAHASSSLEKTTVKDS
jgi:CheY-like chemotaxis protein